MPAATAARHTRRPPISTARSRARMVLAVISYFALATLVLALVFLLFRPQGLFGEKIIDRV